MEKASNPPQFLNLDLELYSDKPPARLLSEFGESVIAQMASVQGSTAISTYLHQPSQWNADYAYPVPTLTRASE